MTDQHRYHRARRCELEATLRRHHAAICDLEDACDDSRWGRHCRKHVGEARRLVALAIAQLYIAEREPGS